MNRAERRKYHYIYKITRHDGKYYIGMHSTDDLDDGYFGSGNLLAASIRKHGKEKHTKEILEHLSSREALKLRERELVNEEILDDKLCMNLKLGGEGGGHFWSSAHQAKAQAAGREALRNLRTCEEWNTAFSEAVSVALKRDYASGVRKSSPGFLAANQKARDAATSKSSCAKRSTTMKLRKHQCGERNSQYGKRWVCNAEGAITIKQEQLDEYLAKGYSRGRQFLGTLIGK